MEVPKSDRNVAELHANFFAQAERFTGIGDFIGRLAGALATGGPVEKLRKVLRQLGAADAFARAEQARRGKKREGG